MSFVKVLFRREGEVRVFCVRVMSVCLCVCVCVCVGNLHTVSDIFLGEGRANQITMRVACSHETTALCAWIFIFFVWKFLFASGSGKEERCGFLGFM